MARAEWPARLQRLGGDLFARLPEGAELWLDGMHNPDCAQAIATFFDAPRLGGRPFHLIVGVLANKDLDGVLTPFAGRAASIQAVAVPDHAHHDPAALAATARALGIPAAPAEGVTEAVSRIAREADPANAPVVLIGGSLYLAGSVLVADGSLPD
ncbi:MAG: bifunctional folylpolyglutamate synthase/dihydrofolate synthase, partial [Sphingomonas bacterium]|nr:bifunctional folylpolyglutamate synthase/dihydrofolate synthase [Sphingomonas bacterium]